MLILPVGTFHDYILLKNMDFLLLKNNIERGRITNGKSGPVADHIYEIWNRTIFVI